MSTDATDPLAMLDAIDQVAEFFGGAYQRLASIMPADIAAEAYRSLLAQAVDDRRLQIEELRHATAKINAAIHGMREGDT